MNEFELKALLDEYDLEYYTNDNSLITDYEYDAIKQNYLKLTGKDEYEYVPGTTSASLKRIKHSHPITSLSKVNDLDSLRAEMHRLAPFVIEPKLDGLTVVQYPGNQFVSRGDGEHGEDITLTASMMEGVNLPVLEVPVRMEAIMLKSVFDNINADKISKGEEPQKNPRNAAAGMLRNKDSGKVSGITYRAYNMVGSRLNESEQIDLLKENGFIVVDLILKSDGERIFTEDDIDEAIRIVEVFDRDGLDYEIDGLVIKSNLENSLEIFGSTGHHPKNAVAYKFPPQGKWTTINSITWQVGWTGKITPVAELEPVDLSGSLVSRATLHNMGIINALGIRINASVFVIKANDVIPAITECDKRPTRDCFPVAEPTSCPVCGGLVGKTKDQLFCLNINCPAKIVAKLSRMAGRDALDIEGLSEETAQKLYFADLINSPFDIYNVTADELSSLPGFAKKSGDKLYAAIQKSRNPDFNKFIYAAGIPTVGRHISKDIATRFGSFEEWAKDAQNEFAETRKIDGIGDEAIKNLQEYGYLLGELVGYVTPKVALKKADPVGKVLTFVITGTLAKPRNYYETMILDAGHKASGSVSAKTDYVLAGEDAGSKLQKAIDLGFETQGRILRSEEELKEKLC